MTDDPKGKGKSKSKFIDMEFLIQKCPVCKKMFPAKKTENKTTVVKYCGKPCRFRRPTGRIKRSNHAE